MATSDPSLIAEVLQELENECKFAVLHGESQVASAETQSDVDVIVSRDPVGIIAGLNRRLGLAWD